VSIDRTLPAEGATRADITIVQTDITQYADFEQALRGCDALIHLAAIPSPWGQPDHVVHNNNVVGSYNALSAAAHLGIERVCQASSVNATGAAYSRRPRYDYFPLDEAHPTYNEDAYSLSKWICEQQGDSFARRYEKMTIASLRFHWVVPERATAMQYSERIGDVVAKHLWGYTRLDATARACLLALTPKFQGHEAFYIVAPDTMMEAPSHELARQSFPDVSIRGDLDGNRGFFNCDKAARLLGWRHDATS
jgi:UDP-glucose 4-epimerase